MHKSFMDYRTTGQDQNNLLSSQPEKDIAELTQDEIGALENIDNLMAFFKLLITVDNRKRKERGFIPEEYHNESDNYSPSINRRAEASG